MHRTTAHSIFAKMSRLGVAFFIVLVLSAAPASTALSASDRAPTEGVAPAAPLTPIQRAHGRTYVASTQGKPATVQAAAPAVASYGSAGYGSGIQTSHSSYSHGPPKPGYHPGGCATYHYVHHGETLFRIAKRHGVSTYALAHANGLYDPNHIYAGQKLCIPSGYHHKPIYEHPKPVPPGHCGYYTVKPGDTLSEIAKWHGTTVHVLIKANHLYNPNHLYIGQVLSIPCGYHPPKPPPVYPPPCNCPPKPPPPPPPPHPPCPCPPHPTPVPPMPPAPQGYWLGSYYNNADLSGSPLFTRNDPTINFSWGDGSPGNGIPNDFFSASWVRSEYFPAGNYRFFATVDDGIRIYVDNQLVLDAWHVQPATTYFGDFYVSAGYHTLRIEYFEETGNAEISVTWVQL